jgi:hypothetical protein
MPLAAAVVGAAIIGGVATTVAGTKAANAQKDAANQQVAEYRHEYDQNRADLAPWRDTGASALSKLAGMYGVGAAPTNGEGTDNPTADAYGGFFTSPGYKFRLDQGNQAVQRSAAARGILGSGATMKAIDRYSQGLASSEYGAFSDRLAQIAGFGQNATNATVAAGNAATQGIASAYGAAGNARASSYANIGSAVNGTVNNALSAYLFSKGGGFGGGVGTPGGASGPGGYGKFYNDASGFMAGG